MKGFAQQIQRLAVLPFFNSLQDSGQAELVNALIANCDDEAHAKRIIDAWLCENRELPTPADLRAMAPDTRLSAKSTASYGCPECNGIGFTFITMPYEGTAVRVYRRCKCRPPLVESQQPARGRSAR